MATHSSILAWKIPWIEEPGWLQSMGSQRAGHDLVTKQQIVNKIKIKHLEHCESESEVTQSNLTLCDPLDCSLLDCSLFHPWDFPSKNTGVGCHFLLQEIFPTQGLNPGLPHCRQMLYHLSNQRSPGTL